ncbi:MAG: sugar phosphate isomerase/epimerase family protein [Verrucomicrobiota bacterium]
MHTQETHSTRRTFLKRAALLPLATVAGFPLVDANAAFTPIKRAGGSHLKISLNAYSFTDQLTSNAKDSTKGLDLFQLCDFCAQHDFDGIDVTGYFFPGYPKVPEDSYIFRLKRHAFDLGLGISGTGVRNDFTTADKSVRAEGVQLIKNWVEVAAKLGAPTVRVFALSFPNPKTWQEASGHASRATVEAWIADALRECADYAQKFGVILAVQNHGDFIQTGEEHLSLLRRVDHESCAAMVDVGEYFTDDPYADIALMAPYAVNWQIKETLRNQLKGPRTDLKKVMSIVRRAGYRGYLPIETLSMGRKGYDSFVEVPKMLAELRAAVAATESILPQ